jgi:hypothetical protein
LAQSKSCSPQWSTNCPDPYGKVAQYETAMARAFLSEEDYAALDQEESRFYCVTIFFFFAGTLLLSLAYFIMHPFQQRKERSVVEDTKSVHSTTTDIEQNEDAESEAESEQKEPKDDVNGDAYVEMPETAPSHSKHKRPKRSVRKTASTRQASTRGAPTRTKSKNTGLRGLFSKVLKRKSQAEI